MFLLIWLIIFCVNIFSSESISRKHVLLKVYDITCKEYAALSEKPVAAATLRIKRGTFPTVDDMIVAISDQFSMVQDPCANDMIMQCPLYKPEPNVGEFAKFTHRYSSLVVKICDYCSHVSLFIGEKNEHSKQELPINSRKKDLYELLMVADQLRCKPAVEALVDSVAQEMVSTPMSALATVQPTHDEIKLPRELDGRIARGIVKKIIAGQIHPNCIFRSMHPSLPLLSNGSVLFPPLKLALGVQNIIGWSCGGSYVYQISRDAQMAEIVSTVVRILAIAIIPDGSNYVVVYKQADTHNDEIYLKQIRICDNIQTSFLAFEPGAGQSICTNKSSEATLICKPDSKSEFYLGVGNTLSVVDISKQDMPKPVYTIMEDDARITDLAAAGEAVAIMYYLSKKKHSNKFFFLQRNSLCKEKNLQDVSVVYVGTKADHHRVRLLKDTNDCIDFRTALEAFDHFPGLRNYIFKEGPLVFDEDNFCVFNGTSSLLDMKHTLKFIEYIPQPLRQRISTINEQYKAGEYVAATAVSLYHECAQQNFKIAKISNNSDKDSGEGCVIHGCPDQENPKIDLVVTTHTTAETSVQNTKQPAWWSIRPTWQNVLWIFGASSAISILVLVYAKYFRTAVSASFAEWKIHN
jgi:hypothetical protein